MSDRTLASIFAEAVNTPPKMEYQHKHRIRYIGSNKISAIKSLSRVTGLTLKSAKEAVEWSGGFMIPQPVLILVQRDYESETGFIHHWVEITPMPEPIEL
jgi:hypothetical protein